MTHRTTQHMFSKKRREKKNLCQASLSNCPCLAARVCEFSDRMDGLQDLDSLADNQPPSRQTEKHNPSQLSCCRNKHKRPPPKTIWHSVCVTKSSSLGQVSSPADFASVSSVSDTTFLVGLLSFGRGPAQSSVTTRTSVFGNLSPSTHLYPTPTKAQQAQSATKVSTPFQV